MIIDTTARFLPEKESYSENVTVMSTVDRKNPLEISNNPVNCLKIKHIELRDY